MAIDWRVLRATCARLARDLRATATDLRPSQLRAWEQRGYRFHGARAACASRVSCAPCVPPALPLRSLRARSTLELRSPRAQLTRLELRSSGSKPDGRRVVASELRSRKSWDTRSGSAGGPARELRSWRVSCALAASWAQVTRKSSAALVSPGHYQLTLYMGRTACVRCAQVCGMSRCRPV